MPPFCESLLDLRKIVRNGVIPLACCAFTLTAPAQQPLRTLLVGVDHRAVTSLNGDWHYLVDQPPAGNLYTSDGTVRDNGYALNTHPNIDSGPHNAEYDFATAPTLKVPGDWNTQEPTLFRFEGVVWYQRDFDFQPRPGARTFLHVGAANYKSYVWVNQKRICDHEGGYTPFDCEVTTALKPGSNFVVIAVDSTRQVDGIPSVGIDWFNYGGLTRDVSLVTLPQQFIDDYDVHLKHDAIFAFFTVNSAAPLMNHNGSIIFNGSVHNYLGQPFVAAYAATKGGVVSMARSIAADLASDDSSYINAVELMVDGGLTGAPFGAPILRG
jgi:beta-glucuronidase